MLQCLFSVDSAAARRNDALRRLDRSIDLVLDFEKSVDPFLFDDICQAHPFFFLDEQIRINKIVSDDLCQDHTDGAFARCGHPDQDQIILFCQSRSPLLPTAFATVYT